MTKEKLSLKGLLGVFKDSFKSFGEYKITKLSGSLAYYTVFSLAPLMIMIISLSGIFLGREAVEGQIYQQLSGFVGDDTASQLQEMIRNASLSGKSVWAAVIGGVALLLGATTVFAEIQDSINYIWGLKVKPKKGWLQLLKNRLMSFSVIVSLAFLLLVSLAFSAVVDALGERLKAQFPDITITLLYVINLVLTFIISTLIFTVIFKVLPDAKIQWRDIWVGAGVTALLFMIGKFLISVYIARANVGATYGAAGSLVILLVWVYYSSMILYFGAAFTKHYALKFGTKILPRPYAVATHIEVIEEGQKPVEEDKGKKA